MGKIKHADPGANVPKSIFISEEEHLIDGEDSIDIVRSYTKVVAASDAPDYIKAMADYKCDGVADNVQVNLAIAAIKAGAYTSGTVLLSAGNFYGSSPIVLDNGFLKLMGVGRSTVWNMANGANCNAVNITEGSCQVAHMTLVGNKPKNTSGSGIVVSGHAIQTWLLDVRV